MLAEKARRDERALQSKRGFLDEDGVLQGGLMAFIRHHWHVLEPETELIEGWPLYAICLHLEAVTFGEIRRLLMNVPPGFMKSLCVDVFWPAWEWGPQNRAHLRYVAFSYSASLTERDNERFRDLIVSPDYQRLWADRVRLVKIGATKVSNRATGWKLASSVGGVGTGERGDRIVLDDPHNVKDIESEIVRAETVRWFRESMSNRLNNVVESAIVIIMQRLHGDDVSGVILELGLDYDHLMIPMEYDWDRQTDDDGAAKPTVINWIDPRHVPLAPDECDGGLAWEERFPAEAVERTKLEIGPYAWAGQYQQMPSPRGGGIFKRAWWQTWQPADGRFPEFEYIIASLDSAFTEKEQNNPSALTVWGVFIDPDTRHRRVMLIDAWRKRLEMHGVATPRNKEEAPHIGDTQSIKFRKEVKWKNRVGHKWGLVEWVAFTCRFRLVDKLLIEAKASGITAAQEMARLHGNEHWAVQLCPTKGDKVARALAVQPTFSQLRVYAPVLDWAEMVITEMEEFPKGKYDDLTDSATQAINYLRSVGLANTDDEETRYEAETVRHKPKQKPLYPV